MVPVGTVAGECRSPSHPRGVSPHSTFFQYKFNTKFVDDYGHDDSPTVVIGLKYFPIRHRDALFSTGKKKKRLSVRACFSHDTMKNVRKV